MFAETWFKVSFVAEILWRFSRESLWPAVRLMLEVLGAATAVSLVVFWINIALYERDTGRRYAVAPVQVSPVATKIAAKFSPRLQNLARDHKSEAINSVDGAIQRWCVGKVWEPAVEAIPRGVEIGTDAALTYLMSMPVDEIASDLIDHAKASGKPVNYTLWQASTRDK